MMVFLPPDQRDLGQDLTDSQQQQEEADHRHDDHVVTDAGPNLQPAAIVPHQEEEVLKIHRVTSCLKCSY